MLYGSYARGDFTSESDIDILVIMNCGKEGVSRYRKPIDKIASRIGVKNDNRCFCGTRIHLGKGEMCCLFIKIFKGKGCAD